MGISDLKTIAIEYISAVQKRENSKQIFEEETHTQQKGEGPTIQWNDTDPMKINLLALCTMKSCILRFFSFLYFE